LAVSQVAGQVVQQEELAQLGFPAIPLRLSQLVAVQLVEQPSHVASNAVNDLQKLLTWHGAMTRSRPPLNEPAQGVASEHAEGPAPAFAIVPTTCTL